jgi:hypothetical protein
MQCWSREIDSTGFGSSRCWIVAVAITSPTTIYDGVKIREVKSHPAFEVSSHSYTAGSSSLEVGQSM